MGVTDQLNKPAASSHQRGRFTLNHVVRCDATASAPVVWTNMEGVVAIDYGEPSWDHTADVIQQGAVDKTEVKHGPRWDGTITVLSGDIGDMLATLRGITWGASHVGLSTRSDDDNPAVIWEAVCRDSGNTHLFSLVLQDIIIDDIAIGNPMDYSDRSIPFHTYNEPFLIYAGYEMVYDVWPATAGTATYALSCGTPVTLWTASAEDGFYFDNAAYIKNKDNSAGDTGMTRRITSGAAVSGGTLTFTTGTPAASDKVGLLYAKAT